MSKEYGASQTAIMRYETYRKTCMFLVAALLVSLVVVLLAVSGSLWAVSKAQTKQTVYFATREDGTITPLIGVEQPYLSDNAVMNFAVEAVSESLSLSFVDLEDDVNKSNIYFTKPAGWAAFITTLENSQMLEFIRNRRVVSTVIAQNPRIVSRGLNSDGAYSWTMQVPLSITYMSSSSQSNERQLATVEIVRVPTWTSSRALGIRQINIQQGQ